MLPALLLGLWAQMLVKTRFNKFSKVASKRGLTGAEAARAVLNAGGVYNVPIGRVSGNLTDHYDPKNNSISLSDSVYGSNSIAAIGVAAHEAGHALQYANNYSPIKFRMALVPICNIGSRIGPLLIVIGCLMTYAASKASASLGLTIYMVGLILFSAVALFQLVTLPVELNASNRAIKALESGNLLDSTELSGAKKVLKAAALTYIAALVTSIMQVLYYASRFRPKK
ncbi:MAG: zinc metallopeptidase [Clostridia bacterium]|nr:zinc metallopeptidase [Clostridia bacterium]